MEEALEIMGITREQVDAQPSIQLLLRGIGGRKKVLELLALSDDPDARSLVEVSRRISGRAQQVVPIEAYCAASKVPTKRAFGLIMEQAFATSQLQGAMLAAVAHPKIVATSIKRALEEPETIVDKNGNVTVIPAPSGKFDRKMMLQHAAFLPMSKGQTIIYGNQNVDARKQIAKVAIVPSVEEAAKKMSERLEGPSRLPLLPAPQIVPDDQILDGDPSPDDEEGDDE